MRARETVTLRALAEELGLNPSTVSRVLNDPDGTDSRWASRDTTERILALAKERGYRKNPHAASLRTAKSHMVGVVVPRLRLRGTRQDHRAQHQREKHERQAGNAPNRGAGGTTGDLHHTTRG